MYGGSKLKKLIDTRWAGHIKSTVAVCDNYEEIISALEEIQSSVDSGHEIKFDGDEIATANGIYATVTTLKFLFLTHMFKELLQLIQPANALLQSREVGYRAAMPIINSLIEDVKHFKTDDNFQRIFSKVTEIRERLDLTEPVRRGRPAIVSQKDSMKSVFDKCIDVVINELTARFTKNSDILIAASSVAEMNYSSLQPLSKLLICRKNGSFDQQNHSSKDNNWMLNTKMNPFCKFSRRLKSLFPTCTTCSRRLKRLAAAQLWTKLPSLRCHELEQLFECQWLMSAYAISRFWLLSRMKYGTLTKRPYYEDLMGQKIEKCNFSRITNFANVF